MVKQYLGSSNKIILFCIWTWIRNGKESQDAKIAAQFSQTKAAYFLLLHFNFIDFTTHIIISSCHTKTKHHLELPDKENHYGK